MTHKLILFIAAFIATIVIGTQTSHAQWRCVDPVPPNPDFPPCEDALINAIEDQTWFQWNFAGIPLSGMTALPYSCSKKPGSGHMAHTNDFEHATNVTGMVRWTLSGSTMLNPFLIGGHSVAAQVAGTISVQGNSIQTASFPNTALSLAFAESSSNVFASTGDTGVADLGNVTSSVASGAIWTATMRVELDSFGDGDWTCALGPPNARVTGHGINVVKIDYPLAWTNIQGEIANTIREAFRMSVRAVLTP